MQGASVRTSKRRPRREQKPSCDRCKANKLRCDAYLDLTKPCSRCERRGHGCVVSREHIRQSSNAPETSTAIPVSISNQRYPGDGDINILQSSDTIIIGDAARTGKLIDNIFIDDLVIDACCKEYITHYLPKLPTIRVESQTEKLFEESPLKFWTVVCIGSRRIYPSKDVYQHLQPAVVHLAFSLLGKVTAKAIDTIEGILLLCNWYLFPGNLMANSSAFVLSGAAYHKALQLGLDVSTDQPLQRLDESSRDTPAYSASHIWAETLLQYQVAMMCAGKLFLLSRTNSFWNDALSGNDMPKSTALQGKLLNIYMDTAGIVEGLGIERLESTKDAALSRVVSTVLEQVKDIHKSMWSEDLIDILAFKSVNLHICALHLFAQQPRQTELVELFNAASHVLHVVQKLEDSRELLRYSCYNILHTILLAATILRRLMAMQPPVQPEADYEEYFQMTVKFCESASTAENDIAWRCKTIVTWLWRSQLLYKNPDGSPNLVLQVRNRLSASILFDATQWFRKILTDPEYIRQAAVLPQTSSSSSEAHFVSVGGDVLDGLLFDDWSFDLEWMG